MLSGIFFLSLVPLSFLHVHYIILEYKCQYPKARFNIKLTNETGAWLNKKLTERRLALGLCGGLAVDDYLHTALVNFSIQGAQAVPRAAVKAVRVDNLYYEQIAKVKHHGVHIHDGHPLQVRYVGSHCFYLLSSSCEYIIPHNFLDVNRFFAT